MAEETTTRNEVDETKRVILRLCRERPRYFSPMGAGVVALNELVRDGLVEQNHGMYALTSKGDRT